MALALIDSKRVKRLQFKVLSEALLPVIQSKFSAPEWDQGFDKIHALCALDFPVGNYSVKLVINLLNDLYENGQLERLAIKQGRPFGTSYLWRVPRSQHVGTK